VNECRPTDGVQLNGSTIILTKIYILLKYLLLDIKCAILDFYPNMKSRKYRDKYRILPFIHSFKKESPTGFLDVEM